MREAWRIGEEADEGREGVVGGFEEGLREGEAAMEVIDFGEHIGAKEDVSDGWDRVEALRGGGGRGGEDVFEQMPRHCGVPGVHVQSFG